MKQTKSQRDRESALTAAFLSIISQGDGFEFTADTLFDSLDGVRMGKAWTNKAGVLFRQMKSLKLLHQTGRAVKSSRNNGQLVQVWRVGRPPKVEPLKVGPVAPVSDFSDSDISACLPYEIAGRINGTPLPPNAKAKV